MSASVWIDVRDDAVHVKLIEAMQAGWQKMSAGRCPSCGSDSLRFYARVLDSRLRRGAIWIWCHNCRIRTSKGNLGFPQLTFNDPLEAISVKEMADLERSSLTDELDHLWDAGSLPQQWTDISGRKGN